MFSAFAQKVVGDRFGAGDGVDAGNTLAVHFGKRRPATEPRDEPLQFLALEHAGGGAHEMNVAACLVGRRFGRVGQRDHLGDPILVDDGVAAVARQQRDRHARNAGDQDLVDCLLEHVQAGDADDRVHVPADNDLEHDRRVFGHEHLVALVLGVCAEVGDSASVALAAVEADSS